MTLGDVFIRRLLLFTFSGEHLPEQVPSESSVGLSACSFDSLAPLWRYGVGGGCGYGRART